MQVEYDRKKLRKGAMPLPWPANAVSPDQILGPTDNNTHNNKAAQNGVHLNDCLTTNSMLQPHVPETSLEKQPVLTIDNEISIITDGKL